MPVLLTNLDFLDLFEHEVLGLGCQKYPRPNLDHPRP